MAYLSDADVIGYGGAGGGGKTDFLIGKALTQHQRSLIIRREASQLLAIIDRTRDILGGVLGASFNGTLKTWRLPDGRMLEMGGVAHPGDEQKWRGRPHDGLFIDEADAVPELTVRFLSGWLRTTVPGQKCQMALGFNPPATSEGRWLLDWFAPWIDEDYPDRAMPGELRWFATIPNKEGGWKDLPRPDSTTFEYDGETITPRSRTFIPAKVTDNPFFAGTTYIAQLQSLHEPLRSQLLYGDFRAGLQDGIWQCIPTAWAKAAQARWKPDGYGGKPMSCLGADIAHGGADSTALCPRHDRWFGEIKCYQGVVTDSGDKAAGLVIKSWAEPATINVDAIGYGSSCCDFLKNLVVTKKYVVPIVVSNTSNKRDRSGKFSLGNIRSAMYWMMREALDPESKLGLALPPDKQLLKELTAFQYEVQGGEIVVEKKEKVKERIGVSPDRADSVCLAWWHTPKMPFGILG